MPGGSTDEWSPVSLRAPVFLVKALVSPSWNLFFFSFPFWVAPRHMELPGQGLDPSHSCNQRHSYGSLTHCAGPGIELVTQCPPRRCQSCCATVGTPLLEFLLGFEHGALRFHFALSPANYAAGPAWCLRILASETVISPGQSTAKILGLLRELGDRPTHC